MRNQRIVRIRIKYKPECGAEQFLYSEPMKMDVAEVLLKEGLYREAILVPSTAT